MVRILTLIGLISIVSVTWAQKRIEILVFEEPSPRAWLLDAIVNECFDSNKYSLNQRMAFYPFNKAKSIKIISFQEEIFIPVKRRKIDYARVLEQKELNASEKDSLTHILYNVGYTPVDGLKPILSTSANCYIPRNGVLFINKAGKAFEYLEICFSCERVEKSSKRIDAGYYCSTKYDLLKGFFRRSGIKYGTKEEFPVISYKETFQLDSFNICSAIERKLLAKTQGAKSIEKLNQVEQTLFFLIGSRKLYRGSTLSGLAEFFLSNYGDYYPETLTALKQVGASLTLKALEMSRLQWPATIITRDLAERRKLLAAIVDKSEPEWLKLTEELYNIEQREGSAEWTPKEDLDQMILDFAYAHRHELPD